MDSPTIENFVFLTAVEYLIEYLWTYLLVLLDVIAKNGFTPRQDIHSDFSGVSEPRQRQNIKENARPEEKPAESSKSYMADQLEAVRRYVRLLIT